jgi:hypothetical protein
MNFFRTCPLTTLYTIAILVSYVFVGLAPGGTTTIQLLTHTSPVVRFTHIDMTPP